MEAERGGSETPLHGCQELTAGLGTVGSLLTLTKTPLRSGEKGSREEAGEEEAGSVSTTLYKSFTAVRSVITGRGHTKEAQEQGQIFF